MSGRDSLVIFILKAYPAKTYILTQICFSLTFANVLCFVMLNFIMKMFYFALNMNCT